MSRHFSLRLVLSRGDHGVVARAHVRRAYGGGSPLALWHRGHSEVSAPRVLAAVDLDAGCRRRKRGGQALGEPEAKEDSSLGKEKP